MTQWPEVTNYEGACAARLFVGMPLGFTLIPQYISWVSNRILTQGDGCSLKWLICNFSGL